MDACYIASHILKHDVFSNDTVVHVKSLSGIREKLVYRQKPVNDMLRITIYYDDKSGVMSEKSNLDLSMRKVKMMLNNRMTLIEDGKSGNGKPKLVFSFKLSLDTIYPIWLEVQFSNKRVTGVYFNDHIDYELKRLKRGNMPTYEMTTRFPDYKKYECVDDKDNHDMNIIMRMLKEKEIE